MNTPLNLMALPQSEATDAPEGSRWVGGPGERLRYLHAGSGSPVVLIHGAMSAAEDMAGALFPALSPHHSVYAFDRPGHGWSDRRRWSVAFIQAQAEAILRAISDLGLERPIVVGHSYGGACALAMALAAPTRVAGVVAISPTTFPEPRLEQVLFGPRSAIGGGDLFTRSGGRAVDPATLRLLWEAMWTPQPMPPQFCETFPFERARSPACVVAYAEDTSAMPLSLSQLLAGAPRCAVPVRVLVGRGDIVASNLHGQVMATAVPHGRVERLPGMGHCLHWFAQDQIRDGVDEIASGAAPARAAA